MPKKIANTWEKLKPIFFLYFIQFYDRFPAITVFNVSFNCYEIKKMSFDSYQNSLKAKQKYVEQLMIESKIGFAGAQFKQKLTSNCQFKSSGKIYSKTTELKVLRCC